MFGYNNYNNSFFSNAQTQHQQNLNDQFWNNSGKNRSGQYKKQDDPGYNRGYKDNYGCDNSIKNLNSGINQMSIDSNKSEKLVSNKIGSSTNSDQKNLSKNTKQSKTMSWASIASQPVKAQPKSFKSKLATVVLSTTKHVPPPPPLVTQVSLDEIESIPSPWSKNKNSASSPPIAPNNYSKDDFYENKADFDHKINDNPYNRNDLRKNNQRDFNRDYNRDFSNQNNQTNYRQFSSGNRQENNDNRYDNNARFGSNSSNNRFDNNRNEGHNNPKYDNRFDNRYQNRNGLNNSYNSHGSRTENRDYRDNRDMHRDNHQHNYQNYNRNDNHPRDFNNQNFNYQHNNNQGYNNYNNAHHNKQNNRGQFPQNIHPQNNNNQHQFQNQPKNFNRPGHYQQLHANNNLQSQNKIQLAQQPLVKNKPEISEQQRLQNEKEAEALLERLRSENDYNPARFEINTKNAKFFIIKSYSEDDIHRSIKYSIWCSTEHGNMKLDNAFRAQENIGPVYLFYSVNGSGHFCGVAQMVSRVDYNASSGVWAQDKWKGQFKVKWIYVKDVPNSSLRHIILENNDYKPVTNSRDTQEVPLEQGKAVLKIIHELKKFTSLFDDFLHYEQKQLEALGNRRSSDSPSPSLSSLQNQSKTNESVREKSCNRDLTSSPVESHNLNDSNNSKTSVLSNYETGYKKSWAEQCN